jgi:hypothetical protein
MLPFNVSYFVLELLAYIIFVEQEIRALPISFVEILPVFELACVPAIRIKHTMLAIQTFKFNFHVILPRQPQGHIQISCQ